MVSPFIKFKNASKETIDASDELVEEFRRTLIQAGQRLSRHIKKEHREQDLENKLRYIEQFCPILVDCLCRITNAPDKRKKKATEGLEKILGRDLSVAKKELKEADLAAKDAAAKGKIQIIKDEVAEELPEDEPIENGESEAPKPKKAATKKAKSSKSSANKEKSAT
jgi:DNA topoisomerase-6 subunit B